PAATRRNAARPGSHRRSGARGRARPTAVAPRYAAGARSALAGPGRARLGADRGAARWELLVALPDGVGPRPGAGHRGRVPATAPCATHPAHYLRADGGVHGGDPGLGVDPSDRATGA